MLQSRSFSKWYLCFIALLSITALSACADVLREMASLCRDMDTYLVNSFEEDDDGSSLCLEGAPCTFQAAIRSANFCRGVGPKTIQLEAGDYILTRTYPVGGSDSSFDELEDERVGSVGLPRAYGTLTIEGNGATLSTEFLRLIHVPRGSTLTINNLTISGGRARKGAGIYNEGTLTLSNVSITSNVSTGALLAEKQGAGIYNAGRLEMSGGSINSNLGDIGAGIYNTSNGTVTIRGTEISLNRASGLSGIQNSIIFNDEAARIEIYNAILKENEAESSLIFSLGTILIDGSSIYQNSGDNSAGLNLIKGDASIRRSTFTMNNNGFSGATVRCATSVARLTLEDVTIYQNEGGEYSNGLAIESSCPARISNTLVAGNSPKDCFFTPRGLEILGANLGSDDSCEGFSIIGSDPLLGPFQDNGGPTWTVLPSIGSPVIDMGSACLATDQRGVPRPVGACDIGAVEWQPNED